jgi:hypothetical protein
MKEGNSLFFLELNLNMTKLVMKIIVNNERNSSES